MEQYATIAGFVAGVIGLIYFGLYAYQQINTRSAEMLLFLEKLF